MNIAQGKKSCFQKRTPEFLSKLSLNYLASPADQVSSRKTNLSLCGDIINQDFSTVFNFFLVIYQIHFFL